MERTDTTGRIPRKRHDGTDTTDCPVLPQYPSRRARPVLSVRSIRPVVPFAMPTFGNGRRVAIVAGLRTPFAKAGTVLKSMSAIELGRACVSELVERTNLDTAQVQAVVFGTVIPSVLAPNIAREVALMPIFPKGVQAYTVSRACASANQAITDAADQIALGHAEVIIAGGAESLSNVPILHSRGFSDVLMSANRAKSVPQKLRAFTR